VFHRKRTKTQRTNSGYSAKLLQSFAYNIQHYVPIGLEIHLKVYTLCYYVQAVPPSHCLSKKKTRCVHCTDNQKPVSVQTGSEVTCFNRNRGRLPLHCPNCTVHTHPKVYKMCGCIKAVLPSDCLCKGKTQCVSCWCSSRSMQEKQRWMLQERSLHLRRLRQNKVQV